LLYKKRFFVILHIASDEKFIDMAYGSFDLACPNGNEFVVVSDVNQLRHIKTVKVQILKRNEIGKAELYESLGAVFR